MINDRSLSDPDRKKANHRSTFEKYYIENWLAKNEHCPVCMSTIDKNLIINYGLKAVIEKKYSNLDHISDKVNVNGPSINQVNNFNELDGEPG